MCHGVWPAGDDLALCAVLVCGRVATLAYDFLGWVTASGDLTGGAGLLEPVVVILLSTVNASRLCLLRAMGVVEAVWMIANVARTESNSSSRCFVSSATTWAAERSVEWSSSAVWPSLDGQCCAGNGEGLGEAGLSRCGLVSRPRLVVRCD